MNYCSMQLGLSIQPPGNQVCVSLSSQEQLTLRDVLGLFPQGRHHPTALFVLRSLVPLVGEESVGGKFRGTGVKLTQLVPGGRVSGGACWWVCQVMC